MRCEDARKYLSPYLDSELDPKTSFDIAQHLEKCDACRARFEAEKELESRLVDNLKKPQAGDETAWAKAIDALPRRRRWARWILPAVAAGIAAGLILALIPRHDLLDELKHDYDKLAAGQSPLDLESSDPAAVERFFGDKMGLAVRPTSPPSMKLMGARKCSLRGTPTAFMAYRCGDRWVSAAVFDGAHLDRFPKDRAAVDSGTFEERLGGATVIVAKSGWKIVCVVGDLPIEELRALCRGLGN